MEQCPSSTIDSVALHKNMATNAASYVAVLPSPGIGHVTPLLELSKLLVTHHNCRVTFLNVTTESSAVQNKLLRSPHLPPNLHVIDLPPVDLSHIVNDQTTGLTRLCLTLRESLRSLNTILTQLPNKPKALIIDMFGTQTFDHDVVSLNIPIFTFFTSSAYLLAFSLFLPKLDRDVACEFVDLPYPVQVPGCKPIRTDDLLDQVRNRKIDEYKWLLYHMSRLCMSAGILLNTWQDLEPVTLKALRENSFYRDVIKTTPVYPIGPLIKNREPERDCECVAWLDNQPAGSVLFVTFGSGGVLGLEQQTELAWGLELSGVRFVWVVRAPNDANPAAAFFNLGGDSDDATSYLPEGFVERNKERGLVVREWAPQVAVLEHVATGAFLSHCGWNSTLESVVNGVPMIAWGLYAEQRMNGRMVEEDLGVGVRLERMERKEVERVVKMVMDGGQGNRMKRRAMEFKQSAANTLGVGPSSYQTTQAAMVHACLFP